MAEPYSIGCQAEFSETGPIQVQIPSCPDTVFSAQAGNNCPDLLARLGDLALAGGHCFIP